MSSMMLRGRGVPGEAGEELTAPSGAYDTGCAGEWLLRGLGGRRFIAEDGVAMYCAPVCGKGFGLFVVAQQKKGTLLGKVNGQVVPASTVGGPRTDFIHVSSSKKVVCLDPTLELPGGLANTATSKASNNARFLVNSRTGGVSVVATRRIPAYTEILIDYGKEYRDQLRKANQASAREAAKAAKLSPSSALGAAAVSAPGLSCFGTPAIEVATAEEAIRAWQRLPGARVRCPACRKAFFRVAGGAHVLKCCVRSGSCAESTE